MAGFGPLIQYSYRAPDGRVAGDSSPLQTNVPGGSVLAGVRGANDLLEDLPSGVGVSGGGGPGGSGGSARIPPAAAGRVSLGSPMPAIKLWNTWWIFALVMFLLTSEWVLRKRKHLL